MPRLKEKLVKTSLDFHPNLPDNTVEVSLGAWCDVGYYVSIWGGDDTSLQTEVLTYPEALELYNSIEKVGIYETSKFAGSSNNNGFPSIKSD
jgi:hypothetical protein